MIPSSPDAVRSWDVATGSRRANHVPQVVCFECFISERVFRSRHISQADLLERGVRSRNRCLNSVIAYAMEIFSLKFRWQLDVRFEKCDVVSVFHEEEKATNAFFY